MSLQDINKVFLSQYNKARTDMWRSITEQGFVIMAHGNCLSLIHQGATLAKVKAIPQVYHDLKTIAHMPITVYLLIKNSPSASDDTLEQYRQRLENPQLLDSIARTEYEPAQRILDQSRLLLQDAIHNRESVDQSRLMHFCRNLSGDLLLLLNAAAIAQVNLMHDIVQGWLDTYNIDKDNSSLKVLIIGPRTARENNLQATYFGRLVGSDREHKIMYIEEMAKSEEKAISVCSTWYYDEQLSGTFFDDPARMHRDLLMSESVEEHIEKLMS